MLKSKKVEAGLKRTEGFIICLDNATVHHDARSLLPPGWDLLPQPPHSPECNKPIEHVHGQMDQLMHSWLVKWRDEKGRVNPSPQVCMQQCIDYFTALPTSQIAADISTLPATWQAIVAAGGAYIDADLS